MNTKSTEEESRSDNSSADRASSLDEMKSVLEVRVKVQPENAEAWRELAQVKMMLGDIDGAENDCIECLRIDPKNASGLVLMGNLLTNYRMDDAVAEKCYAQAVEVGYRLLANYYVSWKIAFPEHLSKIGLPFDDAYALAQQMYDAKAK